MSLSAEIAEKPRPIEFGEITPIATAPSCDIVLRASSLGLRFGAVDRGRHLEPGQPQSAFQRGKYIGVVVDNQNPR